jgi:ATP-dependent RNA helicase SUPV3L1/SUV3
MRSEDLGVLTDILSQPVENIECAGISPNYEQLEMFSNYIPNATFVDLLDIFVQFCSTSDEFFLCTIDQVRGLAEAIDTYEMPLKVRYTFCTVPIKYRSKRSLAIFKKMAKRFASGQPLTEDWVIQAASWPLQTPKTTADICVLEEVFDALNGYLWLGYRYPVSLTLFRSGFAD